MIPRLRDQYDNKIVVDLQKEFSLKNKHMVPKVIKIILNMGLGLSANDKKVLQNCVEDMSLISGQKPVITKFKKSISNFKQEKIRLLVSRLHLEKIKCMNFWIG